MGVRKAASQRSALTELGLDVGHIVTGDQLYLGHTIPLGQAEDVVGNATLNGNLAGFAIEELCLVEGMGKETIYSTRTIQIF